MALPSRCLTVLCPALDDRPWCLLSGRSKTLCAVPQRGQPRSPSHVDARMQSPCNTGTKPGQRR